MDECVEPNEFLPCVLGDPGKTKLKSPSLPSCGLLVAMIEPYDEDSEELDDGGEHDADDPDEIGAVNDRFVMFDSLLGPDPFVSLLPPLVVLFDLLLFNPLRQPFFIKFQRIDCLLAKSACVASLPRLNVLPKMEVVGDHRLVAFDTLLPLTVMLLLPTLC